MNTLKGFLTGLARLGCLALVLAGAVQAQTGNGSIEGRIVSSSNGQALQGAIVRIVNSVQRAETQRDGTFVLRNLQPGDYELEVSYFGFAPRTTKASVSPGGTARIEVDMSDSSDVVALEALTVEGEAVGQARATNQQRVATSMVNITSEEMLGTMVDNNIATALQRLPGLSANADTFSEIPRFVNIRGFNADLNSVQLNGARLPTSGSGVGGTDGAGDTARAFALDDIPGNAVTSVEVVKAPTPDRDGDTIGGIVNLVTKSAFDRTGRAIDFQVGADYVELRDTFVPNFSLGYSDITRGGRLGLRFDVNFSKGDEGFDNIDYDSLPLVPQLPFNSYLNLATEGRATFAHEDTEYNNYLIERDRYGFSMSLDYKLSDTTSLYFRPVVTREERSEDDVRFHKIMDNDHGRSAPTSATAAPTFADTPIGGFYTTTRGRAVKTSATTGAYATYESVSPTAGVSTLLPNGTGRGSAGYRQNLNEREIDFYSLDLGGKTQIGWGTLDWSLFNSTNKKVEDSLNARFDRNGLQWEYDRTNYVTPRYETVNGVDPYALPANQLTSVDRFINPSSSNLTAFQRTSEETVNQVQVDFEMPFAPITGIDGRFKTGVKYRAMERETDRNQQYWRFENTAAYNAFDFNSFLVESPNTVGPFAMPYHPDTARLIAAARAGQNGLVADTSNARRLNSINSDYQASEKTLAGYMMGTFDIGPKFQMTTGVRVEHNWFEAETPLFDPVNVPLGDRAPTFRTDKNDYTEVLPGIHFRYEASNRVVFRAAYTNTYGRPAFREMVAVTQFDDVNNIITTGNPELEPYTAKNYDLSMEYFGATTYFQLALFHKRVSNFVLEQGDTIDGADGYRGLPLNPGETYTVTTFSNQHESVNKGVELAARYRFAKLPEPFSSLYVDGSATYTDSDGRYADRPGERLPTYGASEWLFNMGVGFDRGRMSAQLSYRYRSPYLEGLESVDRQNRELGFTPDSGDDWWGEQKYWNWESSYRLSRNYRLYLNVTNLFEYTNVGYQSPPKNRYPEDSYFHQRRWSFGIKGSF